LRCWPALAPNHEWHGICDYNDSKSGGIAVPTLLPDKRRPKGAQRRKSQAIESLDWFAVSALAIEFSAVLLAAIADLVIGDNMGAYCILFGAAVLAVVVLGARGAPQA
jgi:hypothetical protein